MAALSRKAKQFLVLIAKLLIVGGAVYFIYSRIATEQLEWNRFGTAMAGEHAYLLMAGILLFTFLNRFFEILKWQNLAGQVQPISLWQSAAQVLAAVTAAIFTPNGLGEYAAKALYYKKDQAKEIVFLNLICNGVQMVIAILAGLTGLIVFNILYKIIPLQTLLTIIGALLSVIALVFTSRKITIRGYSIQRLIEKINAIPKPVRRKNILLALLRYLCIVHQHYFIFLLFGVALPYSVMISSIAGIYFLGSALPNFQMIDFAVRGSVAVFFFGILGVNEWIVVFAATLQWLLNIVLPVSIGTYFVFSFKPDAIKAAGHQE